MDEKQHLLQELQDYEYENKIQSKRIKQLESALKECVDDKLFKIWFTTKYHKFKKLLGD
jgi:hypothetical protein